MDVENKEMEIVEIPVILDNGLRKRMYDDGFQFRFDGIKRQWYMTLYKCDKPHPDHIKEYVNTGAMLGRITNGNTAKRDR